MKIVEIDREGECDFRVSWFQIVPKSRLFDSRDAAESFAVSKAGKTGMVISTLDMTAEQLTAHYERKAKQAEVVALVAAVAMTDVLNRKG